MARYNARRLNRDALRLIRLEDRIVPTSNVFLDFGDNLPAGGLVMTALQLRNTFAGGGVQGPNLLQADNPMTTIDETITDATVLQFNPTAPLVTFDYDQNGVVNATDYTALRAAVLSLVQRYYAPFDVTVQIAPALNNATSATYIAGVQAQLMAGANADGERDGWVFVSNILRQADGASVGGLTSNNGVSAGVDIGGKNARDDSCITYSDVIIGNSTATNADTRLAYTAAHEPGHDFGLQHTNNGRDNNGNSASGNAQLDADMLLMTSSNVVTDSAGAVNRVNFTFFSRFDLVRGDNNVGAMFNVNDTVNHYEILANNDNLGLRAGTPNYFTGTGAFDQITVTSAGANLANVTVRAFREASFTNQIGMYVRNSVDISNGLFIELGLNADVVSLEATLAQNVTIRGMAGNDTLAIDGKGAATGSYQPDLSAPTGLDDIVSFGGMVNIGSLNVIFSEFEPAGALQVRNVTNFLMTLSNKFDTVDVAQSKPGETKVSGFIGGVAFVPLFVQDLALTIDGAGLGDEFDVFGTGTSKTVILGGSGTEDVEIKGDGLTGAFEFHGGDDNDLVNFAAGIGIAGNSVIITGDGQAAGARDILLITGRAIDDAMTLTVGLGTVAGGGGSSMAGLGQLLRYDTFESVTVIGLGGKNDLLVCDATGLTMGSILDPFGGIVFRTNGKFDGDLRFNGDKNTGVSKTLSETPDVAMGDITGQFRVKGDNGVGPADLDTLTVLGFSTNKGTFPFNENAIANGSDTITVSDKSVTMKNAVAGEQLTVFLADTDIGGKATLCNLVLLAGNENPPKGDEVKVTPSAKVNIFLDGQDPKCGIPGDKLIIDPKPTSFSILKQLIDDPKRGPAGSVRIVDTSTPLLPGFNFINFETVVGASASVVGTDKGAPSIVKLVDPTTGQTRTFNTPGGPIPAEILAFPGFFGGVRVAAGDLNGDGIADIVAGAGPGGGSHVKAYDGIDGSLIASFFAYNPFFAGGVNVAVGDIFCDGTADIITGPASAGGPHVKIFRNDGLLLNQYFAYAADFTGGVTVASGDLDGDGGADIVTGPGEGLQSLITVRRGSNLAPISSFLAYGPAFHGGVFVGVGDVSGDDVAEIITGAGNGGGPHLRVFDALGTQLTQFFVNDPFAPTQIPQIPRQSGLRVALADVDGDGVLDILATKGPCTRPFMRSFRLINMLKEPFRPFVFDPATYGFGVFVGGSR